MLEIKNLASGYGMGEVISEISLSIKAGEKLAIIGPNGCGKTTLLRAIAGILPYSGEILLHKRPLREMKQREAAASIAMLSQISGLYFSYSVYDTVMMGRYAHIKDRFLGMPAKRDHQQVRHSLESVGLWDERRREITELSGGQLQRVFLARTLAQEPEILLLDEPTNHLDLKYQAELVEHLAKSQSYAVVGVFHDINLALQLRGKLMLMKNGKIRALGEAEEIISGGLLEEVYEMDVRRYMRRSLQIWEELI